LFFVLHAFHTPVNSEKPDEHYFFTAIEFVGVLITFLILEHGLSKLQELHISGIKEVEHGLPVEEILESIKSASFDIIIMDTYLEKMVVNPSNRKILEENLHTVLKRNPKIEIKFFLVDPACDEATKRIDELLPESSYKNHSEFKQAWSDSLVHLDNFRNILKNHKEIENLEKHFSIEIQDTRPPFSMYSIDGKAYVSFYRKNSQSTNSLQLCIPNNTDDGKLMYNFFVSSVIPQWQAKSNALSIEKYIKEKPASFKSE